MAKVQPILDNLTKLRYDQAISLMTGDYKGFKQASKDFASIAVKDFELAKQVKGPVVKNVPLFSRTGFKMAKVWFLNLFRIKTTDEKELAKLYEKYFVEKKFLQNN